MDTKLLNHGDAFKLDDGLIQQLADEAAQRALQESALEKIEESQGRPEDQNYLQRLDTKALIKTEEEYAWCLVRQVQVRSVTYAHALQILDEEKAAKAKKIKKRHARKRAKASRKANR